MERIDAFVTKKTPPRAMAEGLRNGIKNMAECYGFDYHDRLEWLVADTIDRLSDDIDVLTKERDAAVADLKDHGRNCKTCLHGRRGKNDCLDREEVPCKWEWRGVQEAEHEAD